MLLLDLPDDVLHDIARFLDEHGTLAIRSTCNAAKHSPLAHGHPIVNATFALMANDASLFAQFAPAMVFRESTPRRRGNTMTITNARLQFVRWARVLVRVDAGPDASTWQALRHWVRGSVSFTENVYGELVTLALESGSAQALRVLVRWTSQKGRPLYDAHFGQQLSQKSCRWYDRQLGQWRTSSHRTRTNSELERFLVRYNLGWFAPGADQRLHRDCQLDLTLPLMRYCGYGATAFAALMVNLDAPMLLHMIARASGRYPKSDVNMLLKNTLAVCISRPDDHDLLHMVMDAVALSQTGSESLGRSPSVFDVQWSDGDNKPEAAAARHAELVAHVPHAPWSAYLRLAAYFGHEPWAVPEVIKSFRLLSSVTVRDMVMRIDAMSHVKTAKDTSWVFRQLELAHLDRNPRYQRNELVTPVTTNLGPASIVVSPQVSFQRRLDKDPSWWTLTYSPPPLPMDFESQLSSLSLDDASSSDLVAWEAQLRAAFARAGTVTPYLALCTRLAVDADIRSGACALRPAVVHAAALVALFSSFADGPLDSSVSAAVAAYRKGWPSPSPPHHSLDLAESQHLRHLVPTANTFSQITAALHASGIQIE
ncbi:hypothetical protein BC828DRAFT_441476 [Blastocladiella britannica]|nr:hypothetical protein BC828DRAFT_441476 [Blastocladiella britannica]